MKHGPLAAAGALLLVAAQSACVSSAKDGSRGEIGTYDDGGPSFTGGNADGSDGLDAHIERNHMTVKFVTLSCAGPCADVVAVATGGQAPYTFRWEDGSTSASRHVCPASSTNYHVTVTDTGTSGELARPSETAETSLTADVIACPDGGTSDAGAGLCVPNPSFEGMPGASASNASPWTDCAPPITNRDQIGNAGLSLPGQVWTSPAPTDGKTFLLVATNGGAGFQAASEALCGTLHAGTQYSLKIDLTSPSNPDGGLNTAGAVPASLQLFGGSTSCSQTDLLWTSSAASPTWKTFCATFTPSEDATYLTLAVTAPPDVRNDPGYLYVDHIVPVASCQ